MKNIFLILYNLFPKFNKIYVKYNYMIYYFEKINYQYQFYNNYI